MIRKETANPCSTEAPCQAAVVMDGSGFDGCHTWWKVAPKAIYNLSTLAPTDGGGTLSRCVCRSYDLGMRSRVLITWK